MKLHISLKKLFVWAIPFCLCVPIAEGQDYKARLQKVFQDYRKMEAISIDIKGIAYKEGDNGNGEQVMAGLLKLKKDKYYSKMDGYEMLVNGTDMIVVDHEAKEMTLCRSKGINNIRRDQPIFAIDSLLALGGNVEYLGRMQGNYAYKIKIPKSVLTSVDVLINEDNFITRLIYYFSELPGMEAAYDKLELRLENTNTSPTPDDFFREQKFLANRKKRQPSTAYKNYSIKEVDYDLPTEPFK
ncbi:MAG: hypothetical protein IPN76_03245 [Saprospiraceae bacterium]|nr:hypothetical protein [Saprospiraceae bacterium]